MNLLCAKRLSDRLIMQVVCFFLFFLLSVLAYADEKPSLGVSDTTHSNNLELSPPTSQDNKANAVLTPPVTILPNTSVFKKK